MKKILFVSILSVMSLMASEDSTAVLDQTYTNDVMDSTNRLDFINAEDTTQVSALLSIAKDVTIINIPMSFRVTKKITLDANVPILNLKNSVLATYDATGMGDISLGLNYQYGNYSADTGLHLATFRYKSTTGDIYRGLGSGKPAYTFAYNFAKDIAKFRANAYISYTINDPLVTGDALSFMLGGSHQSFFLDTLRENLKFSYFKIAQEAARFGYTQANIWVEFSSDSIVSDMRLSAGIKIPLIDDIIPPVGPSIDGSNGFLIYVSTANIFATIK